jgi:hypothetical protein
MIHKPRLLVADVLSGTDHCGQTSKLAQMQYLGHLWKILRSLIGKKGDFNLENQKSQEF